MVPRSSTTESPDLLTRNRVRVSWLVYAIAATGLVIDAAYIGIEYFSEHDFLNHVRTNLLEQIFILSLLVAFPVIAFLTERVINGFRLSERSRALELEVAARTRQLEDLKSFSENIMASVNDVIFVIGSDGRFQFVSGDSEAVLGSEPDALIGRQFSDIVAPGAIATAVTNFEKVMWGHEVQPYELEVIDVAGQPKFIEISGTAYRERGNVIAQVGVARDITERKKLEQHAFERNRELAALNDVAGAVGQTLDPDQILGAALDQAADLFTSHRACIHLYDADTGQLDLRVWKGGSRGFLSRIEHLRLGEGLVGMVAENGQGMALNVEDFPGDTVEAVAGDGVACVAAVPMKFRGRLIGVLGVGSEQAGRFSQADLSLLGAIGGQVAMALENALLFEDLQKKTGELATQNTDLANATQKISHLIAAAEKERSFSVRFDNPGLVKCWEFKNCAYTDCPSFKSENLRCWQVAGTHCGGEVQGVFAQKFGRCEKCDVYKVARADRLAGLGEAFNNMMAMLEQQVGEQQQLQEQLLQSTKLAALGELAANIAHEINNPLTGVLGYAALLQRGLPENDTNLKNLKVIENETIRARDIVRNLLDFARQEGLKKRKTSIREVMDDTLSLLRKQADLINVKVVLDYEDDVPKVNVDVNQMKQVFINILNNALHSMERGGQLTVSIRAAKPDGKQPWVEVAFQDTGSGIPPEKLELVFNPFYTSKDVGEGTGLGLSVSQRIVEEHGGVIEVVSKLGKGSTFTVKLPTANISTGFKRVA
ncbi:MAG: ATP-binding protein [Actinobacteria bacterium]|nr:ATP-binding protein [Actinomycetota bacterium]